MPFKFSLSLSPMPLAVLFVTCSVSYHLYAVIHQAVNPHNSNTTVWIDRGHIALYPEYHTSSLLIIAPRTHFKTSIQVTYLWVTNCSTHQSSEKKTFLHLYLLSFIHIKFSFTNENRVKLSQNKTWEYEKSRIKRSNQDWSWLTFTSCKSKRLNLNKATVIHL